MKKDFLKYGNLIAFIAVVVINILATMGVIGGVTTRDVSYMYKSLIAPADYAFSIWSIIYVLLAIMVYLQLKDTELNEKLGYWFAISCILNIAWIIAWQNRLIALSFILIFALMGDLIVLMRATKDSKILPNMTVGLYTGWINVAMLANLGAMFVQKNWLWFGLNGKPWAIIGLVFGILWIGLFEYAYYNVYYAIGAAWAYLGIAIASDIPAIKLLAIIGAAIFILSVFFAKKVRKDVDVTSMY